MSVDTRRQLEVLLVSYSISFLSFEKGSLSGLEGSKYVHTTAQSALGMCLASHSQFWKYNGAWRFHVGSTDLLFARQALHH